MIMHIIKNNGLFWFSQDGDNFDASLYFLIKEGYYDCIVEALNDSTDWDWNYHNNSGNKYTKYYLTIPDME